MIPRKAVDLCSVILGLLPKAIDLPSVVRVRSESYWFVFYHDRITSKAIGLPSAVRDPSQSYLFMICHPRTPS